MTTVLSFASQKGGVGKTTSAVNLSTALAVGGYRVLLIDLDPQGSIRPSFGINEPNLYGTREIFTGEDLDLDDLCTPTDHENLDFILSNISPITDEQAVNKAANDYQYLNQWLRKQAKEHYDFVVIDSPASMGPLTLNALVASDLIIVPLQCEALAIKSLKRFLLTFKELQANVNPHLRLAGILMTMYDRNLKTHRLVCRQVYGALQDSVFKTIIPKCAQVVEASAFGKTVLSQNLNSVGATAYVRLANELLDRFHLR